MCSIPHFITSVNVPNDGGSRIVNTSQSQTFSRHLCSNEPPTILTTFTNETDTEKAVPNQHSVNSSSIPLVIFAIGMIVQGIGKAPRYPMLTQYLDDNTKKGDTGFYMGKSFHLLKVIHLFSIYFNYSSNNSC